MKLTIIIVVLALLAVLVSSSRAAVFTGERLNRPFTIHGRLNFCNGSANTRIWIVGSKRLLYVGAPSAANDRINAILGDGGGWFDRDIYADYTVQPLERDIQGHMRPVKIIRAKNVVITKDGKVVKRMKTLR